MSPATSTLEWLAPLLILAGAAGIWFAGLRTSAWLAALAACCWQGARLIDESSLIAGYGLLSGALWEPLVAVVAFRSIARARRPAGRTLVLAASTSILILGVARTLVYEPFLDPSCRDLCVHSPLLARAGLDTARSIVAAASLIGIVLWATIAVVAVLDCLRQAGWARLVPATVGTLAIVMAARAWLSLVMRPVPMPEFLPDGLNAMRQASGFAFGAVVLVVAIDRSAMWRRVRGVSRLLTSGAQPGSAQAQLAAALGDRDVAVSHWVDDLGFVDAAGQLVESSHAGRRWTELSSRGQPIALVEHAATVAPEILEQRLGPSVRLAIQNENLQLQLERHVDELARSRRRVVDTAEAERRRLERDLHDGAQQRILALSFELRRGLRQTELLGDAHASRDFGDANAAALTILRELRELAHGIYPAELGGAGLAAALRHLADNSTSPLELQVGPLGPMPEHVERAAYVIVRESVEADGPAHTDRVTVRADGNAVFLVMDGVSRPRESALDRLAAVGGRHRLVDGGWEVELSCG